MDSIPVGFSLDGLVCRAEAQSRSGEVTVLHKWGSYTEKESS